MFNCIVPTCALDSLDTWNGGGYRGEVGACGGVCGASSHPQTSSSTDTFFPSNQSTPSTSFPYIHSVVAPPRYHFTGKAAPRLSMPHPPRPPRCRPTPRLRFAPRVPVPVQRDASDKWGWRHLGTVGEDNSTRLCRVRMAAGPVRGLRVRVR